MFSVNDTVIYGTNGVCTIRDITTRAFGKEKRQYYVLTPFNEASSVIYVPTANEALLSKMRRVLSVNEIYDLIDNIKTTPCEDWITDETARRTAFKSILQSGDRRRLILMIKTIYFHGKEQKEKGRKLHHTDELMMKDAEALLYNEFAYVLHLPKDGVLPFLIERIEK